MALTALEAILEPALLRLDKGGLRKGRERVITGIQAASGAFGPRYFLAGEGERPFLRMNANAYLALNHDPRLIEAEAEATRRFGTGPGAVRFISGTFQPHIELENQLAAFHDQPAAMLFSAAYAAVLGVLPLLISDQTLVISDALNHNCIINAIRLARPAAKEVYPHLDMTALEDLLSRYRGHAKRVIVVSDGVFSMRGDHAPLAQLCAICASHQNDYEEGVVTVVDDSHGIGAFGSGGRGTEEQTGARADILIATLGKALGVNGGYVVASQTLIDYLRETAPLYIYSNPITPAEAAAASVALKIVASAEGKDLIRGLQRQATRLRTGFEALGLETVAGAHPIVPLLLRDTAKTRRWVETLFQNGILATGLSHPVVPRGDEAIRFQISAEHTDADIDQLLAVLETVL